MDTSLVSYLLPVGVLDFFELTKHNITNGVIHFYLEEKNEIPNEYASDKAHSKGFTPEITIQDFPLRGKSVYLHIRRRRWVILSTQKIVTRDWDVVAKGTRMTSEFASFLKE